MVEPVFAQTATGTAAYNPTPTAKREVRQTQVSTLVKGNADLEIARRITALQALLTRITAIKKLTTDQKNTFSTEVQAEITSLTTLKSKIDSDTDLQTLRTDKQSIITSYRVFALFMPQITILSALDRLSVVSDQLTSLASSLQTRIQEAQTSGKDVTVLKTTLTDMNSQITNAKTAYTAATTEVLPLTPEGYPGNRATLLDARTKVKTGDSDLKTALKDGKIIMQSLKALNLTTPIPSATSSPTASSTPSPTQ